MQQEVVIKLHKNYLAEERTEARDKNIGPERLRNICKPELQKDTVVPCGDKGERMFECNFEQHLLARKFVDQHRASIYEKCVCGKRCFLK